MILTLNKKASWLYSKEEAKPRIFLRLCVDFSLLLLLGLVGCSTLKQLLG